MNGGAIRDPALNAATLTLASPGAAGSIANSYAFVVDGIVPTATMQLYADAGLTTTLADNAVVPAGIYYVKITASETLASPPTISINAQ